MKTIVTCFILLFASSFVNRPLETDTEDPVIYDVQLVSNTPDGSIFEWVWAVTNPVPGNGKDGTLQDLSHWGLAISSAVLPQDIVSGAYSTDGITWHPTTVSMGVDPSQNCYTEPVVKFNIGTHSDEMMQYKLVLNQDFGAGSTEAVFKSGKTTGCYVGMVEGPTDGSGAVR